MTDDEWAEIIEANRQALKDGVRKAADPLWLAEACMVFWPYLYMCLGTEVVRQIHKMTKL